MAAFAAAELLVALSPLGVDPAVVSTDSRQEWGFLPGTNFERPIGVSLHFTNPDDVTAFARAVGARLSTRPGEYSGRSYIDTVADGEINGVPFHAWARTHTAHGERPKAVKAA